MFSATSFDSRSPLTSASSAGDDRPPLTPRSLLARPQRLAGSTATWAILVGIVAFALYARTAAPGVMWYDMGEFTTSALTLGIAHNTGYPLYSLLGKLFSLLPLGDPAYRINLFSAFTGALAVALTVAVIQTVTRRLPAAVLAGATFAVSSTLWGNSTWAEVYGLNAVLTIAILGLLIRFSRHRDERELLLATFIFGIGLGNHRLLLGVAAPIGYVWMVEVANDRSVNRGASLLRLVGAFLLGSLIQLYLPIRAAQGPPVLWADATELETFVQIVTTGKARAEAFYNPFAGMDRFRHWLTILRVYPASEFTPIGLVAALFGGILMFRRNRKTFWMSLLVVAFTLMTVSTYGIHDIFNYFLPIYQMLTIWLGTTIATSLDWIRTVEVIKPMRLVRPGLRTVLAIGLFGLIPASLMRSNFPILDRSGHGHPSDYASLVWSVVEPGSVVLTDFWSWTPLLYDQVVLGRGEGVFVQPALADADLDLKDLLAQIEDSGFRAYLATRSDDAPNNRIGPYSFRILAPNAIQGMPTDSNPLPSYKDLLVPRGGLYQVGRGVPELEVDEVPSGDRHVRAGFDAGLMLEGFGSSAAHSAPGEWFEIVLYWQLTEPVNDDLWADVLFADSNGRVEAEGGIPLWQASHWLGSGAFTTRNWEAGNLYSEAYYVLVPQDISLGTYEILLFVYQDGPRQVRVPLAGDTTGRAPVRLGSIEIVDY